MDDIVRHQHSVSHLSKSVWWKSRSPARANPTHNISKSAKRARGEKGYSLEFPMLTTEVPEDCTSGTKVGESLTVADKQCISPERIQAAKDIKEACALREKWIGSKRRNTAWQLPVDPLSSDLDPKSVCTFLRIHISSVINRHCPLCRLVVMLLPSLLRFVVQL